MYVYTYKIIHNALKLLHTAPSNVIAKLNMLYDLF